LWRILDLAGQQDCARAGAESRLQSNELLELLKTSGAKKFEERAGLATGNHQPCKFIKLLWLLDQHHLSTEFLQASAVRIKVALKGKDADLERSTHSMGNSN